MTRASRGNVARTLRALEHAGWTITHSGSGHYKCRSPKGNTVVIPATSDRFGRGILNSMSELRRGGAPEEAIRCLRR